MNAPDQVPAGLETDMQVAEQVLGWRKLTKPCDQCRALWRPHYDDAGKSVCLLYFSADMNVAMALWTVAFKQRKLYLQRGPEDGEWAWGISEVDPDHFHVPVAFAPSPALTICRAALLGIRKNA